MEEMLDKQELTEEEAFRIKGLDEALDITKQKEEHIRGYVEDMYEKLYNLVADKEVEFDILDAFSTLGKTGLYLCQSYFNSKEEFDKEYEISRKLVTENLLQALGVNADNEELNRNSVVTYNGERDMENFSLRRIMMLSFLLNEYALWQLTLSKTFSKLSEELN